MQGMIRVRELAGSVLSRTWPVSRRSLRGAANYVTVAPSVALQAYPGTAISLRLLYRERYCNFHHDCWLARGAWRDDKIACSCMEACLQPDTTACGCRQQEALRELLPKQCDEASFTASILQQVP
jgi:hypothetical protein